MAAPPARDGRSRAAEPIEADGRPRTAGRPVEWRRLLAVTLSALIPGLGQATNGRFGLAAKLLLPTAIVVGIGFLIIRSQPPIRLAATLITPTALQVLAIASLAVLAWRSFAVLQAFFDRRYARRPGLPAAAGLALALGFVAIPHGIAHLAIGTVEDTYGELFARPAAGVAVPAGPAAGERLNILLVGVDRGPGRAHALTDTIVLASLDPVGGTASLISVPRDTAMVPLGNGDEYGPRINSLYSYAESHPDEFPAGPMRTLQDAVGALLDVDVHYYATIDMAGFSRLVDAAGGVTVTVTKGFFDPTYGYAAGVRGWGIEAGVHHLDGREALAYVRSRKAEGESDFTRAARQQQVLVAMYRDLLAEGSLLFRLPELLRGFGAMVETDLPPDRLPEVAAVAEGMDPDDVVRVVIKAPLLEPMKSDYGNVWVPRSDRIEAMTAAVLPEPGTAPTPWPPKDD